MYIHVPTPPPAPSKNAKEVGAKLAELVRILRRDDPSISSSDVQQGINLAQAELRRELGGSSNTPLVVALLAGLLALGVAAYFIFGDALGSPVKGMRIAGLTVAVIAVLGVGALVAAISKRR